MKFRRPPSSRLLRGGYLERRKPAAGGPAMTIKVNLNADMAEGYGAYDIGNDREILRIIGSASIACGFHAGAPLVMRRTIAEASRVGGSGGAHSGVNELRGFGRRLNHVRCD